MVDQKMGGDSYNPRTRVPAVLQKVAVGNGKCPEGAIMPKLALNAYIYYSRDNHKIVAE